MTSLILNCELIADPHADFNPLHHYHNSVKVNFYLDPVRAVDGALELIPLTHRPEHCWRNRYLDWDESSKPKDGMTCTSCGSLT